MKKCLNCRKDISHKHPNAKFCRNKGRGNCKDKFHNRTNPRGIAAERDEFDIEDTYHPMSSEALGQWS